MCISNLLFPSEDIKEKYFLFLRNNCNLPICKKCGKIFGYAFPDTEQGLEDYMICLENELICLCENYLKIKEMWNTKKDKKIDISEYYE